MYRVEIIEKETGNRITTVKVSSNEPIKVAVCNAAKNLGYPVWDIGYRVLGYVAMA